VGWSRRIGVAGAFVLLIGAGIAFASGTLDNRDPGAEEPLRSTGSAFAAPTLLAPEAALTSSATVDIHGLLPADRGRAGADRLRVYVNDRLARERPLPAEERFRVNEIPLDEGVNEIRAALLGDGREGELSTPISIVRDSTPPSIRIARPESGATAYGATETVRGRTEPGASLTISAEGSTNPLAAAVTDDGRFEGTLHLEMGENMFVLRSEDLAGNRSSTRLVVTRATSLSSIILTVSVDQVELADLPATLDVVALVRDELGRASDGADVTFGLSPPNRGTTTYRAVTAGGEARWPGMIVAGDARAVGTWLVTVLAVLPSGEELRGDASFSVR
jgi:hypothetical protein